jgi:hypothetical protein
MSTSLPTRAADWSFVWPWLLGFGLTAYLGLSGGGFDPLLSGQAGIAIWWVLLLTVLVAALPRRRLGTLSLCALGLLAAFVLWTALSLRWTESTEKTAADLAQVTTFLGVFALALFSRADHGARRMLSAVAAGIVLVSVVALLSRLHPSWFPEASQTGRFLKTGRERLSYPLDYWNGLAALIAIGLPLVLQIAGDARQVAVRALAAAALPAMFLAIFLTLSRGGIAAGILALAVYMALSVDRIPRFFTLLVTGIGGGALILLANHRYELVHGFTDATARSQGNQMLWLTIVVCIFAGLAQLILSRARRPQWAKASRRQSLLAIAAVALVGLIAFLALSGPSRVSHAWHDFKQPSGASIQGTSRLGSIGGENRYQLWSSAIREFDREPLKGTGSGTFQLWWTRDGDVSAPILDTHSLYLQVLGELGIVGLAILLAFVATTLAGGTVRVLRASAARRSWLAAALAGSTVLWMTSLFDWVWKIPIIPIAALLLIAVTITAGDQPAKRGGFGWPLRAGIVAAAIAALIAIAIPLASTSLIRQSQASARDGDTAAALADARSAQNVQPGAATPRIQEALLLESEGEYAAAASAAAAASEREPTNWRTWLLLSRIEAERGQAVAAVADYRRARSLNPLSPVFSGP